MKVYVYTLGCRLNQCESEAIMDSFLRAGFQKAGSGHEAGLVIVNSCTVTTKAEQKARRMIRMYSRTAQAVIVTGCYAQMDPEEVSSLVGNIHVFSLRQKGAILDLAGHLRTCLFSGLSMEDALSSFHAPDMDPFVFDATSFSYHSRAYLKVQDGCDNHCGFCRTSIARGPSVSLPEEIVVERALKLEREGFHEIMLTGVNLTMYDHGGNGLGGLCEKLLSALGDAMRIRFSSMEADHIDDRLLDCIRDPRIQPHFHLPIQTASDRLLKRIGRNYSMDHVRYVVDRIRQMRDDPFFACDIIAGLPGETDEDFGITVDFLEKYDFASFHVFPYSPREGTALFGARDFVEERVRDERAAMLRGMAAVHQQRYLARQMGKRAEILVEERLKDGLYGTTGNYIKAKITGSDAPAGSLLDGCISNLNPVEFSCGS